MTNEFKQTLVFDFYRIIITWMSFIYGYFLMHRLALLGLITAVVQRDSSAEC